MRQHFSRFGVNTAALVVLLFTGGFSLHAVTINWTNTASGNWNTAVNWDPNSPPGTNDTAVITNAGVTVFLNSSTTVGGITLGTFGAGTTALSLNGQTLILNGPLTVYPSGSFTVDSGTLAGNTNAVLRGTIGWTAGTLGGTLTLASGSTLNITTGNTHSIGGCILTNSGTVNWSGGFLYAGNGAVFYNYGLWNAQDDQQLQNYYGGSGTIFNNYGTFRKSGGASEFANSTYFTSGVVFNQLGGVIDVQNGTNGLQLGLGGGGNFIGGYITTNVSGLTVLASGSFNINGTVTGTNTWVAGTLMGTNVINSGLTWEGGSWNNTVVTVSGNSVLNITTGNNHFLGGCSFTNSGTVNWSGGFLYAGNGAVFYNYGLWNAQDDQQMQNYFGGAGAIFNNYGTFRKSGGASEFANSTLFNSGIVFNQLAGVIDVRNGTNGLQLGLAGGGSFTGGYITTNVSGLTVLASGSFNINGTITGTNTWVAGTLVGTNVINSGLTWEGGSWNNTVVTVSGNSVLNITTGNNHFLGGCIFTNSGTVNWSGGNLYAGSGTVFYNYGLWNAQDDQQLQNFYGGSGTVFNNYGTFRKSGGASEFANNTLICGGVVFNQLAGVIDVQNGTNGLELAFQGGANFTGGYIATNQFGLTVLSSGNFTLNGTLTGTNTWLNGGNLAGTSVIHGTLTWVGGTWNGAVVTIPTNSTVLVIGGTGNNDMNSAVVTNYGTVAWASGALRTGNGTLIYNYGLWDAQSDQQLNHAFGGANAMFNNYGPFRKSGGTNAAVNTLITSGVQFNLAGGLLDVASGNVVLQGGGNLTGGSIPNSAGATYLSQGSFNINGTATGAKVIENAGNLVGMNVINGALTWLGGVWSSASIAILSNSTVIVAGGGNNMDMNVAVVTNYGTLAWSSGTIRGGNGTAVYNYGLWDAQSDQTFNDDFGGGTVFNNLGTFRKSGGTNAAVNTLFTSGVLFNQTGGLLDVASGNVVLQGGGNLTGGSIPNSAGATYLSQGSFNINGTATGAKVIENAGNLVGTNVINGTLNWLGGVWNSATIAILSNSTVIVAGGENNMDMNVAMVTNYGVLTWSSGTIRGGNGTLIYNYGLWDAQSDQQLNNAFGGANTVFNNLGTFRKSAGANTTTTDNGISFRNTGIVGALSGTLRFNSSPAFAGGMLSFGIGGSNSFGLVTVGGTANLAGSVSAVLLNGYTPSVGSQFDVMTYGATNGTFTDYSGLNAGSGVAFTPILSSTNFILSTVATNFTAVAPTIISQPSGRTANYGDTVTLQVTVSGSPTLLFQWNLNNVPLPGATNATLTLSSVTFTQAGAYTVAATNSVGGVLSRVAQLTVVPVLPSFASQPQSITVPAGSNALFSVTVLGEPPPVLQWQFNGTNLVNGGRISGSSSTILSIASVHFSDAGSYSVIASNAYGAATSSTAVLHVGYPDLAPFGITAPATATLGQTLQLVFNLTNSASGRAYGPWLDQFQLALDTNGTSAYNLGTAAFNGSIPAFSSVTITQSVIMPASIFGTRYFGVVVDSATNLLEVTRTNNTTFAAAPILINGADLALEQVTAPGSAQYGQSFTVGFAVTNIGTASAIAGWNDRIYFSSASNALSGATLLASLAGTSPLAPGEGYVRSQSVTIPQTSSSASGTFYLMAMVDPDNAQLETNKANNFLSTPIPLTLPPLPDLVAGLVSSPTNATPGQTVSVSWAVTNIGPATANGSWQESVYLVPASLTLQQFATNVDNYPSIGVFTSTNNLASGSSVTRTQLVTIPLIGFAGDLRVAVIVNSDNNLLEQNSTNDSALALNDLQVPAALSLSLPVASVPENTSTPNLACLVSRNGDLGSPLVVSLASSATNHLLVPASVTIPAGAASAPWASTVLDDGVPGPDAMVTISASAGGYLSATSQVTVVNTDVAYLSLSLAGPQITEGQTVLATVTSSTASSQPLVVGITSSSSSALASPSSVTIPANSNFVSFIVLAVQNTYIAPAQTYTLSVSAGGYVSASTTLTVLNNNAPKLALSFNRTNFNETDGPYAAAGFVSRDPVTDQSVTIALVSTNTGAGLVPAQVVIPSLQASALFYVAAVNDTNVTGPKVTLISAQTLDSASNPVGIAEMGVLTVEDVNGPLLNVTIASKVVPKGANPATTAVVWTTTPPTNDLVVTLTSSDTNEATVPATVTIPAGQTNAAFNIVSLNDGIPFTNYSVTITASAANYAIGSDVLNVTDLVLPDLVITSITAPAVALTAEPITVGFRLMNQGLGALTNGVSQYVYLTTNPATGTYLAAGSASLPGPLAAGQYVDESLVVPGSSMPLPGVYYVVVMADGNNNAAELNKANNALVGAATITVLPEYTATVKASVSTVLAGAAIPLSGSATLSIGGPATNKPVSILLTVRGLQRVISVVTDANGNFSTVFTPFPTEAGVYTVSAVLPGVTSAPAQDQFNIVGMSATPASLALTANEGGNVVGAVSLQNLSDVPLSGLTATVDGLAANLAASATFSTNYLAGQGLVTLSCLVAALDSSVLQSSFTIHLTSNEGAALDVPVAVKVNPLLPHLVLSGGQLNASMLRGAQTIVRFDVVNQGGAATGPLTINLPSIPWLSVASTNPMPSIAPGATNQVTLLLSPDATLALGPYTGSLAVIGSGIGLQVPFTFTAVSDAHGALSIQSVDEYTYFATGSPPLTNASVTLLDPFTQAVVARGSTDSNGLFFVSGVMEGVYELDLSADQHVPFRGAAVVTAGQINSVTAFLSRQAVTLVWTVVPTSIQDTTHITITATFETDVPEPVVVPNPLSIDLAPLTQPGQYLDIPFTLVNYGLIAVHDVTINISDHPLYRFDLVTRTVDDLPAHGSVTIPMRITRLANPGSSAAVSPKGLPCEISFNMNYDYDCGSVHIHKTMPVTIYNVLGNCGFSVPSSGSSASCVNCGGGGDSGYSRIYNPGGQGGWSLVLIPPSFSLTPDCNPCYVAVAECVLGFTKIGCVYGLVKGCAGSLFENGKLNLTYGTGENCASQIIGCINVYGTAASCLQGLFRCLCPIGECWKQITGSGGKAVPHGTVGGGLSNNDLRDVYLARSYTVVALMAMMLGDTDGRWFSPGSGGAFGAWFDGFNAATQPDSPSGLFISPDESTNLLALPRPNTVSQADVQASINRWNLSISNWVAGILSPTNAPFGADTNFIDAYAFTNLVGIVGDQYEISQAAGYDSPLDGFIAAMQASGKQAGSVCARVVLEIDQDAVLTRDAFRATLKLNNSSANSLSNLSVSLVLQNAAGQDVTSLFGIEAPVTSGSLTSVDGKGSLPANTSGSAQWTLIPSLDAAPQAATNYLVSGTFSYVQNEVTITIPLSPAPINVQPNPELYLKYFLQRDVFADDPFTPDIEPSIPFPLVVMVQNKGYGTAQNFQITSAQPTIVDNEKGLLINFKIIGTQVAGQAETPSLTANFGDMAPQSIKIGKWLFTSSLQGLFVDYKATFEHIDPLGNPRLSLIQGVDIHEMVHMVQAPAAWDDGQPDFLTVETPNYLSLPDTLYLSDGTRQPVSVVQTGATDGPTATNHLQVQFTASLPAGFTYVIVPDPANGQFPIVSVQDSNGTNLLTPNFYTTDRTFIGLGQRPLDENMLHLFDYHTNAGAYTYTLVYQAPSSVAYTSAPVSSVFTLPAQSPPTFGVAWSGAPYVGQASLAYYDIYMADDGGPYALWQSQTTATGAFFNGTNGHAYAFYSMATDTVGNREAIPLEPQAQTTVNVTNYLPTISVVSNVTINAGQTLSLSVTASDPNPFATLTFGLGSGAPTGMTIDPNTGQVNWPTSPAFGGTTNPISIIVADNSQPPLTATGMVSVAVIQVITPPVLSPIANYTINEGSLLTITNSAIESNLPPRSLVFSLGAAAPTNAVIDPASGLFQWRPTASQAPSTNTIVVVVTDNGVPPLSATQPFTVVVRAVTFEFLLGLGSTNVLVGNVASVPVTLQSSLPLSNITAIMQVPASGLTNWALLAASPEITSTLLQSLGTNRYSINLTLNPTLSPGDSRTLAQLAFLAGPQAHSAMVPLNVPSLSGVQSDGSTAPKPGAANGRVVVIAREPLLEAWIGSNSTRMISLYGNPGTNYLLLFSTNLLSTNWQSWQSTTITNVFEHLPVDQTAPQIFYRAQ
jgi:hypothetical protein